MADVIDLIEQGKIKRYFRARNKCCFDGAVSHITQHSSGTEPLFLEDSDYLYMLHLMKEVLCKFKCKVLSFSLMPNHIHLLLKFLESNMPNAMKELLQKYAEYFNRKYQRKGHVFSGAYRSALCCDDGYLLAASLYIHINPVKKGLVKNPADYRWSSCALFLNEAEKETFIDYKFILAVLDDNIYQARMQYKDLLGKVDINRVNNVLEDPGALETMVQMLKEINKGWCVKHSIPCDKSIDEQISQLKGKGKLMDPQEIKARAFLIEQLRSRSFNITEIAEKLGLTRQAIYKIQSKYTLS
ncbi:MAG: transposase [Candidatus Omnitrophota bacterium]